jgi:hypothetical protein
MAYGRGLRMPEASVDEHRLGVESSLGLLRPGDVGFDRDCALAAVARMAARLT